MMADALDTAIGKPGTDLKVIYIGTLAPSRSGWWSDLIQGGSGGSTYVQALRGDLKRWDQWSEIRRVNPLVEISGEFRKTLLEERDKARRDSRLKARFLFVQAERSDGRRERAMLLTVSDYEDMTKRSVPDREGRPTCSGRSRRLTGLVCCAWRLWPNGRIECRAVAPGLPSLADQERSAIGQRVRNLSDGWPIKACADSGGGASCPQAGASLLVEQITEDLGQTGEQSSVIVFRLG